MASDATCRVCGQPRGSEPIDYMTAEEIRTAVEVWRVAIQRYLDKYSSRRTRLKVRPPRRSAAR